MSRSRKGDAIGVVLVLMGLGLLAMMIGQAMQPPARVQAIEACAKAANMTEVTFEQCMNR